MDKISNENRENMDMRETAIPTTEHLAMEILKNEMKRSKAKDMGLLVVAVLAVFILIAGVIVNIYLANVNQKNNKDWLEMFSSYDYVSQDGEGVNNINTGSQGNINNIPKEE